MLLKFCTLALILAIFGAVQDAHAMYAPYKIAHVPLQRLISNLESSPLPDDSQKLHRAAQKEFKIARLYAMSYSLGRADMPVYDWSSASAGSFISNEVVLSEDHNETWPEYRQFHSPVPFTAGRERPAELALLEAIKHYRASLALESGDDSARLGLAWCLDQHNERPEAIIIYRDLVQKAFKGKYGSTDVNRGYEAALYLRALLDPTKDQTERAKLRDTPKPDYRPQGVTPIVIPLCDNLTVTDIMTLGNVRFDLGLGVRPYATWPAANSGWLVYDRTGAGKIYSGAQMFGNYSFCLFCDNGYEALSLLDDNHDGKVDGAELKYLAIWQDKNQNGISEKSEVMTLTECGITGLSCRFTKSADGLLLSRDGVVFKSGAVRTSFDVVLSERDESKLAGQLKAF